LLDLIHLCFDEYWDEIWFGIMVPGAAWEVAAPNPPKPQQHRHHAFPDPS
jgi:hypothetical protein